jgi:DNA repair photolyase
MGNRVLYQPTGRAGEYSAWAVNLFKGCPHGCAYCFAAGMARRFDTSRDFSQVEARPDVLRQLERDVVRLAERITTPVLLSFTCDCYSPHFTDEQRAVTRQAIGILKGGGLRVQILTKAGLAATGDFDLLGTADSVAASLTLLDEQDSQAWEPGAAAPAERIALLRAAKARGLTTWASLEPVIEPEQTLSIIRTTAAERIIDYYAVGKLNHHQHASTINWRAFAREVHDLLETLGVSYRLKDDLQQYLS